VIYLAMAAAAAVLVVLLLGVFTYGLHRRGW
jgi:hypothetical protein